MTFIYDFILQTRKHGRMQCSSKLTKIQNTHSIRIMYRGNTYIKYVTISQRRYSSQNASYAFSISSGVCIHRVRERDENGPLGSGSYSFHLIFEIWNGIERMGSAIYRLRKTAEKHMRLVQCIHFLIQYLCSKFLHFLGGNTVHMCFCCWAFYFCCVFSVCSVFLSFYFDFWMCVRRFGSFFFLCVHFDFCICVCFLDIVLCLCAVVHTF